MDSYKVIIKPVVTEKSLSAQGGNCFSFWVNPTANKNQIKQALVDVFGIKPLSVRTVLVKGATKRLAKKNITIRSSDKKKAIVQLKKGDKISLMVASKK